MKSENAASEAANSTSRRRRRRKHWLALIIFVIVLLLVASLVNSLFRFVLAPWSLSSGGRPAMIGEWSGPVTLENGVTGTLLLTLGDDVDAEESWLNLNIDGSAHYCLGDMAGDFEVYGEVDRQGNISDLRFRPLVDDPIWLLHSMSSQWQGETIALSGSSSYDLSAAHIARSDVPEAAITITLQRAAAETNCVR